MSVAYKETIKKEKWGSKELVRRYENGDIEEIFTQYDQRQQCDKIIHRTVKHPDGSAESYNQWNILEQRFLSDGSIQNFYDSGKVSLYKNPDRTLLIRYDEDGNIIRKEDYQQKHFIAYTSSGEIKFEFSPEKTYLNPKFIKPFKLGMKDRNKENHWVEDTTLDPRKKTVIFYGGNGTWNPKSANGYLNSVIDIFGITDEQLKDIQLVSCYRQMYEHIVISYLHETGANFDFKEVKQRFYKQETLLKLMPFMAQKYNGSWERISPQQLYTNFRNIMLISHCHGSEDICITADILKQTMTKLGYGPEIQKNALRQIVCITNNTQREFNDNTGFTVFHRYSVSDGQYRKQYTEEYSTDYPVFLENYAPFHDKKKSLAAFISLNKKEMLMVFNRVLQTLGEDEHNSAFWTMDKKILTSVGKMQAAIIKSMGQYWLNGCSEIKSAADFIKKSVSNLKLRQKMAEAFIAGNRLQKHKMNPLHNSAIIDTAYLKYKHSWLPPEEHGAWKLLSAEAKADKPEPRNSGLYIDFAEILSR